MYQEVTILGRLGTDPTLRYTPSGVQVCNFSVAVNRRWSDAEGDAHEETTWFKVVTWQGLADTCAQYLKKGRLVLVNGRIRTRQYQDPDGVTRQAWELVARDVRFADNGTASEESVEDEDLAPL